MNKSETIEWLTGAVGRATGSEGFCASGRMGVVDPGLEVEGLGAVRIPLQPAAAKKLVAACKTAPYGKGTRTLVDKQVRNTFELDPKQFRLSDAWSAAVAEALPSIAEHLGLPAGRLEAKLYKLLVYEKGGFFLPHRDSEKHDRMVASLIVALPNPFEGGELVVGHGAVKQTLGFEEAADGEAPCYAAFFADCEHEVRRVYRGVRLCLAYNLVLKPSPGEESSTVDAGPAGSDALASSIAAWVARQPADPVVFALDHHYTERGLSLDLLKGDDRRLAGLVAAAAETALADALCATAVARFCKPRSSRDWRRGPEEPTDSEASLPDLLKALMASGRDKGLARVIRFVEKSPDAFRMDECLVPGLKTLVPWARRRFRSTPPALAEWLEAVRRRLQSATAARPKPPADWARPANLDCKCGLCAKLKTFLADPSTEVTRIAAREDLRRHLIDVIRNHQSDVDHGEERKGSPYSLVLTKTTGSFDRAVKRYEADRRLLAELPKAAP